MDGKSIKSPTTLTKTFMAKFPVSRVNNTGPRSTITNQIIKSPQKPSPLKK